MSLVQEFKEKAKARLKELNEQVGPLLKEKGEIEEILNPAKAEAPSPLTPSGQSASGQAVAKAKATRKRRSRKGGTRHEQFVELVKAEPGISVNRAAEVLQIQPNYLYRIAKDAVKQKEVKKKGREYLPA